MITLKQVGLRWVVKTRYISASKIHISKSISVRIESQYQIIKITNLFSEQLNTINNLYMKNV